MRTSLLWLLAALSVAGALSPALAQKHETITKLMPPAAADAPVPPRVATRPAPGDGAVKDGLDLPKDDLAAFEYLRGLTARRADDDPLAPRSRMVAKAFVALANYYLVGIPNSPVKPDPARARKLFAYAAMYFRDADAQYHLGRLLLDGVGGPREPMPAARWLSLAADKDHHQAQALLGRILFYGDGVPRQAARGLVFLMLASEGAAPEETWIGDLLGAAFKQASADEQAQALVLLGDRLRANGNLRAGP